MFEVRPRIEPFAYILLALGAVGDWISTKIGLASGLMEGNAIARGFMSTGSWVHVDLALILVCILIPVLVTRFIDSRIGKMMLGFPFCAGLMKIGVVLWNLSLIMA